jgi:hypothetical protein
LRLIGLIKPTKPTTPVLLSGIYPIHFHHPEFILQWPGSAKLSGDTNAFKPALPDSFGFFHELFGGSNHLKEM